MSVKSVGLVLVAILLANVYAQSCFPFTCVGEGETCDPGSCNGQGGTICSRQCKLGLQCIGPAGKETCRAPKEGADCFGNPRDRGFVGCARGGLEPLQPLCVFGKCKFAEVNHVDKEPCETSSNCLANLECVDGKCVGRKVGERCFTSDVCEVLSYCHRDMNGTRSCQKKSQGTGAATSPCDRDDECYFGSCFNDKCVEYYSVGEGGLCSNDRNCGPNMVCRNVNGSSTCTTVAKSAGRSCVSTSCPDHEDCVCDNSGGSEVCFAEGDTRSALCGKESKAFYDCMRTNKCHMASSSASKNTCADSKCRKENIDILKCNLRQLQPIYDEGCIVSLSAAASASFVWQWIL